MVSKYTYFYLSIVNYCYLPIVYCFIDRNQYIYIYILYNNNIILHTNVMTSLSLENEMQDDVSYYKLYHYILYNYILIVYLNILISMY